MREEEVAVLFGVALQQSLCLRRGFDVLHLFFTGDAAAIAGSASIFTGLFGFLILGETLTIIHMLLMLLCWFGVALVVQTNDNADLGVAESTNVSSTYLTIGLCVVSPVSIGLSLALSRKVSKSERVLHIMFVNFSGMASCALAYMAVTEGFHLPTASSWKYLLCDALGG